MNWENLSNQTNVGSKGAVSDSTIKTYNSAIKTYERTIKEMSQKMEGVPPDYPITEETIRNFIEYYRKNHITTTYPYLKQLVAGISFFLRSNNLPNITLAPTVVYYMRALKREMTAENPNAKIPIDKEIMNSLAEAIDVKNKEEIMLMTMASLCFYGFLRISECCKLRNNDVWFDELDRINIYINNSKTDQNGNGVTVFIYRNDTKYSPHKWLNIYFDKRKIIQSKLFNICSADFRRRLKTLLSRLPISIELKLKISTHSFRKGAAMCASRAGVQDCRIKAMGRWKSECYQRYTAITMQDAAEAITKVI